MEDYLRLACQRFKPLMYVLCANGALFVEYTPPFVRNRVELANIYLEKSASHPFINDRSPDAALTLNHIAITCFRLQKNNALLYLKYAAIIAKSIGLNTEDGIEKLTLDEWEKENYRRIWWCIFQGYAVGRKNDEDIIASDENNLFLPVASSIEEKLPDYYTQEVMQSPNWYTPSAKGLHFQAYRVLLLRIQIKVDKYVYNELSNTLPNANYVLGTVLSSINDLKDSANELFQHKIKTVKDGNIVNPQKTWIILFCMIQMNCLKVILLNPKILKSILTCKKIHNGLYFKEAVDAAMENGMLLDLFISNPDSIEYLNTYFPLLILESAFILICTLKHKKPKATLKYTNEQIQQYLESHYTILNLHAKTYNRESNFYNILKHLESCESQQIALEYGECKSVYWHYTAQKPKSEVKPVDISQLIN
ncbi:hypothetical protein HDV01_001062 [Terramyces sp. JEL0728]|nr:hypothetical protein HDV01_001062 [Terramyces sp. JEL0728]